MRTLILCMVFLIAGHLINLFLGKPSYTFDRLFHLDHESNLPTWFSSVLWAIAAISAYYCSQLAEIKFEKRIWGAMALVLLVLSISEVAMLHEQIFGIIIGERMQKVTGVKEWLVRWPIMASPVILFVIIWFAIKLKKCLTGSRRCALFLAAGTVVLIASACVLEVLPNKGQFFEFEVFFEETGEMIGALLIISGLLAHRKVLEDR